MSIKVKLWSFSKRENSTKQPTGTATEFDCLLKEETSIVNPELLIHASNLTGYNYAQISDFGRYYFIRDIVSVRNDLWRVSLECDTLASYKSSIIAGSHYVLRASSSYDEYITDTAYISKMCESGGSQTGSVDGSTMETDPFAWGNGHHSYVLGIISKIGSASDQIGSIVYYWLDSTELQAFCNYLMNDVTAWSGINTSEYSAAVQAALLNPAQYIVSAVCLPFDKPSAQGITAINFGYYSYNIGGNIQIVNHSNMVKAQTVAFTLPKHPQAATRGAFMNGAPFTRYTLHLGPFGDIPIDPMSLIDDTGLQVNIRTDLTTGISRIWVAGSTNSSNKIYTGSAQVGVPINISQVLRDPLAQNTNMVNGIVDTASAAAKLDIGGAIKAEINGLADATRLQYPSIIGGGAAGSMISFHDDSGCYLGYKFLTIVDENLTEIGRPLCQTKTLSTLSGYILCLNADCEIAGTQEEATKINDYLNGGCYIE